MCRWGFITKEQRDGGHKLARRRRQVWGILGEMHLRESLWMQARVIDATVGVRRFDQIPRVVRGWLPSQGELKPLYAPLSTPQDLRRQSGGGMQVTLPNCHREAQGTAPQGQGVPCPKSAQRRGAPPYNSEHQVGRASPVARAGHHPACPSTPPPHSPLGMLVAGAPNPPPGLLTP